MTSIPCPRCGQTVSITTTELILPDSPALMALLKGTLNVGSCGKCQNRILLDKPLLYRDEVHGLFLWSVPGGDWRALEPELMRMAAEAAQQDGNQHPPFLCRLVLSRRGLVEKIMLFQNGFDDALVEYIKFNLYNHPDHPINPQERELLYDFSATDNEKLMFLVIDRKTGLAVAHTHLEMSAYQELAKIYADTEEGQAEMRKIFPGPYVSANRMEWEEEPRAETP